MPTSPLPGAPGIRAANRASIQAQLLAVARTHLAQRGAAALSVRAVARDLGMVPSALFRYVSGRDELLTLLIIDAYDAVADAVEAALAQVPREDLARRWQCLATAFRSWALSHPHEYALIYGSPVPRYDAPAERTGGPGTRVPLLLAAIGADAYRMGVAVAPLIDPRRADELTRRATAGLTTDPDLGGEVMPAAWLANGMVVWTLLVGAVSSEVFGQLGTSFGGAEPLFDYTVAIGQRVLLGL
jgi:AcrR family transcriptional regulator